MLNSISRLLRVILLGAAGLSFAGLIYGEEPAYPVYFLETEPVMDGKVSGDAFWDDIPAVTGFFRFGTQDFSAKQTLFKIGYTQEHIYAGIEVYDIKPQEFKKKDSLWKEDLIIELFFVPQPGVFYQFAATPFQQKWNTAKGVPEISTETWEVKSQTGSDSCSLEIKIPLNIFPSRPSAGEIWGLNVGRSDTPGQADRYSCWSPVTEGFAETAKYRRMEFRGKPADRTKEIEKLINSDFYMSLENKTKAPRKQAAEKFPQYEQTLKKISGSEKRGETARRLLNDIKATETILLLAEPGARELTLIIKNVPAIELKYEDLYFRFMLDSLFE